MWSISNLGVQLDSQLTMADHIAAVCCSGFYSAAIAEQFKRCISYGNSVRLSVCPSVCHTLVPYLDE